MKHKTIPLLENIINHKRTCVFISPHLDDALLSCGGLISFLKDKTKVVVITVFTHAHDSPKNLSTRRFVSLSGYQNSQSLFSDRRFEDQDILNSLKVECLHLGFTDSLYRLKPKLSFWESVLGKIIPEVLFVYPTYRWHIKTGNISSHDNLIIDDIQKKLNEIVFKFDNPTIFSPSAIGGHLDHRIIRNICEKTFPKAIFWSDFPYNFRQSTYANEVADNRGTLVWDKHLEQKIVWIKKIKTQVKALFPDMKIPKVKEYYFFSKEV